MNLSQIPVEYILKAAKIVKRLAYLIAVIGAVASYGTQVELLKTWGIEGAFSYLIPATVDLLAICAAIALQIPGFPDKDRKSVYKILIIAVLVSVTANVLAGAGWGAKAAHAWPVVAYLLAEYIANKCRTFAAAVLGAQAAKDVPQPEPAAPTAPVIATVQKPTAVPTTKPLSAKARILELAAVTPPISPDEIAAQVGTKPGWVKHVIKTSS
jgi:hypothetical protein